jgi:hypothetical protein
MTTRRITGPACFAPGGTVNLKLGRPGDVEGQIAGMGVEGYLEHSTRRIDADRRDGDFDPARADIAGGQTRAGGAFPALPCPQAASSARAPNVKATIDTSFKRPTP